MPKKNGDKKIWQEAAERHARYRDKLIAEHEEKVKDEEMSADAFESDREYRAYKKKTEPIKRLRKDLGYE